jgi:hypothetical protein
MVRAFSSGITPKPASPESGAIESGAIVVSVVSCVHIHDLGLADAPAIHKISS